MLQNVLGTHRLGSDIVCMTVPSKNSLKLQKGTEYY